MKYQHVFIVGDIYVYIYQTRYNFGLQFINIITDKKLKFRIA